MRQWFLLLIVLGLIQIPQPEQTQMSADTPSRVSPSATPETKESYEGELKDLREETAWMADRIMSARFLPEGSCGFFWRTDYGPAYCDQGKDHAGSHRCWGSQGAMTFAPSATDRSRSPVPSSETEPIFSGADAEFLIRQHEMLGARMRSEPNANNAVLRSDEAKLADLATRIERYLASPSRGTEEGPRNLHEEIQELLVAYLDYCNEVRTSDDGHGDYEDVRKRIVAIESYVSRLRDERDELLNALIQCGVNAGGYEVGEAITVEVPKAVAALASLKERQLTPGEARWYIELLDNYYLKDMSNQQEDALLAKLRLLSTRANESERCAPSTDRVRRIRRSRTARPVEGDGTGRRMYEVCSE